ncbi:hypothetical protein ACSHT2_13125 [Bradyrhizobium sp. PUT101]|uniref:hypothetical protein n=1 Tax=Bradyrhizobium sp. PUT101 TaxID=3447427 RepID=UPI003F87957F
MPGLVPGIHVLHAPRGGVDGRDEPGHDVEQAFAKASSQVRALPAGKSIPSHLNEFSSAKLICRFY